MQLARHVATSKLRIAHDTFCLNSICDGHHQHDLSLTFFLSHRVNNACYLHDVFCDKVLLCALRLFRAVSKPRPGDQPLLIVFVIGGVSSTEVRQVRDVVAAAKTSIQVT